MSEVKKATGAEIPDDQNPKFLFQTTHSTLLAAIVQGKIDPVAIAAQELANQGLDINAKWVGFTAAQRLADKIVAARKQRWEVTQYPTGTPADNYTDPEDPNDPTW